MQAILNETTDGTGVTVRSDIDEIETSGERHRFLCNTLREGLSNGIRHGGATAFWVEVKEKDGVISFLLSDNGTGVDMKTLKKGFGLTTTAQHAERLGGSVEFRSETGEGFEIYIVLGGENAKD
jgi:signal transduction histidine kinase